MSEEPNELHHLRREIAQLRAMFLLLIAIGLLVLVIGNLVSVYQLPQFEKTLTETLSTPDKMPQLTRWVLDYVGMQDGQVAIIAITAVPVLTLLFLFVFRRSFAIVGVAGLVMTLLVAHWMILAAAVKQPMQQVIQEITSGE